MSENNSNSTRKKSARASIAAMDYGIGASANPTNNFGMGKAARSLLSGPLANTEAKIIALSLIDSNPDQPRVHFDQTKLEELSADIKERGVLQPPIVREMEDGRYEIVAGERRCRAARMAGLTEIPVIIKEFKSEQEARLVSLAENLQRDDLDIEDEARFLRILQTEMKMTLRQIADVIHRSHLYVYRRLEIGQDAELLELYRNGQAGIETLLKIARIPKNDKPARTRAINDLKKINDAEEPLSDAEIVAKSNEVTFTVTARNSLKQIYKLGMTLQNLSAEKLLAEEKAELGEAMSDLESIIADVRRKMKTKS